jgi:hypothetical protein
MAFGQIDTPPTTNFGEVRTIAELGNDGKRQCISYAKCSGWIQLTYKEGDKEVHIKSVDGDITKGPNYAQTLHPYDLIMPGPGVLTGSEQPFCSTLLCDSELYDPECPDCGVVQGKEFYIPQPKPGTNPWTGNAAGDLVGHSAPMWPHGKLKYDYGTSLRFDGVVTSIIWASYGWARQMNCCTCEEVEQMCDGGPEFVTEIELNTYKPMESAIEYIRDLIERVLPHRNCYTTSIGEGVVV